MPRGGFKSKGQRPSVTAQLDLFSTALNPSVPKPETPPVSASSQSRSKSAPPRSAENLGALVDYVLASDRKRGRPEKQLNFVRAAAASRLLDVREAAQRLGLSKSTLDKMRCSGRGPRFIRATDRAVRYDPADLDAFAAERRRQSTSQDAAVALGA